MPVLRPMKMPTLLGVLLTLMMLFGLRLNAAPYDIEWTRQLRTSGFGGSSGAAVDGAGNVFMSGYTTGDLDGNGNQGGFDAFLAKYDAEGNLDWTKQLGTSGEDNSYSVAVDGAGNVFVSGYTGGGLDGNENQGSYDAFLTKYDAEGNLHWLKQLGTSGDDYSNSVAVDGAGNVFVSGETGGDLGGNGYQGDGDAFVTKYDANGNRKWTKQLGTSSRDRSSSVAVDGAGNVLMSGYTAGDLDGNEQQGDGDAFLAKYDAEGNLKWTKQLGTSDYDASYGTAVDGTGNIFISGVTTGDLGGNGNQGGGDAFVTKYDAEGNLKWTKQLGTSSRDYSYGVAVDETGNLFMSGETYGDLGENENQGGYDAFLTKYDAEGNLHWLKQLGTSGDDRSFGVAVDGSGNVFMSGVTEGDLDGNGYQRFGDAFVMKFSSDSLPGDLNDDGRVSLADLAILQSNLGKTGDISWADGDLDGNHLVDRADLSILRSHYGNPKPSSQSASAIPDTQQVPEPSSLVLFAFAAATLSGVTRRRRREQCH